MPPREYTNSVLECPMCLNSGPMIIRTTTIDKFQEKDDTTGMVNETGDLYSVLGCPSCESTVLSVSSWGDWMEDESELTYKILYPPKENTPQGLPSEVKKAYNTGRRVKVVDPNSYGLTLRRVLEIVCIDKGAKGQDLYRQIEDLANKQHIPANLVPIAQGLRILGNIAAHPKLGELTENEIPILRATVNAILEYVYTAPFLVLAVDEAVKKFSSTK